MLLRGHSVEFGVMGPRGRESALKLIRLLVDAKAILLASVRSVLFLLVDQLRGIEARAARLDH
jgi:hypothetical protein